MSRIRRAVVPFTWRTVTVAFTQGTAASADLNTFLVNGQRRTITWSLASGTWSAGVTLNSATGIVSYDGTTPVASSVVQFRATSGAFSADSATITASIVPASNRAPIWALPATLGNVTPGRTVSVGTYVSDPDSDPITIARVGGTAPAGVTVSTSGIVTVPADTTPGTYTLVFQADDGRSTAASDWLARSTAPGVVWAHDFSYDAEVSAHLGSNTAQLTGAPVRRVLDSSGAYCLEQMSIGATLAQEFLAAGGAGPRTMMVNDASDWPASDFYFFVTKKHPNIVGSKNLFYCSARTGNSLTVTRQGTFGFAGVSATAQDYAIGDYAGAGTGQDWRRTFSALPAGENGLPTNDPAAANTVPLRSKSATGAYGVPRDASLWQYGWYGHIDNHTTWANWTGNSTTGALTPRGVQNGAAEKYRLWDGTEFWLQFRVKVDARFFANHQQPDPTAIDDGTGVTGGGTVYWTRKLWMLQSEISSLQQITTELRPSNRYSIPATNPNPLLLSKGSAYAKANSTVGVTRSGITFYQPGGPWDATAREGSAQVLGDAWEWVDGEWVTVLLHVVPGRSGLAESTVEIKIARTEQATYDGSYTTVISAPNQTIYYSGGSDRAYPASGSFDQNTISPYTSNLPISQFDTLPGYQAWGPTGYLNLDLANAPNPPPKASYYVRFTQIIFSKQSIPAPAVGA